MTAVGMRSASIALLLLALASVALAQKSEIPEKSDPALGPTVPLTVKGHTIGESVQQFAAVLGLDFQECEQVANLTEKAARKQKLVDRVLVVQGEWYFCRAIVSAAAGNHEAFCGYFEGKGPSGLHFRGGGIPNVGGPCGGQWNAELNRGRLVVFTLEIYSPYTYSDVVQELVSKYGKPTKESTQTLQNAYGARAEAGEAIWHLPPGMIITSERIAPPTAYQGWERYVIVSYLDPVAGAVEKLPPAHN